MLNAGYATLQIIPSMKGSQKAIESQISGRNVGDKAGTTIGGRITSRLGSILKKGAIAVGVAAGGVLATSLVKGWGRLVAIENATAKLTGLGHSAGSVKSIMTNALAAVKGTAFGLDEAASTAAGSVAAGVKPGKDLERTLKLVADAATIGGSSMGEMGAIFNKVAATGKVQGEVINQLGERGIPILQLLGKEIGKTPQEVAKLASQGKIDFDTFRNAMEKGLGGAALKSGETTQGAFKNMGAALGRFGALLLGSVFPIAKQVFGGITTLLDNLGTIVGPWVEKFSGMLAGGLDRLKGSVDFGAIADKARELFDTLSSSDRSSTALSTLTTVFERLMETGTTLWPAMQEIGRAIAVATAQIGVSTWDALLVVLDAVSVVVVGLAPQIASLAQWLAANQPIVTGLVGAMLAYSAVTKAIALGALIKSTYAVIAAKQAETVAWLTSTRTKAVSMAQTVALYAMYAAGAVSSAASSAAAWVVSAAQTVAAWVTLRVQAVASAVATGAAWAAGVARTVAAWVVLQAQALATAASTAATWAATTARVVAGWVLMGVQSLLHAARMAAAWLIALGPIGWAIAAVIAVVAVVVANWDKVVAFTKAAWTAVVDWVKKAWEWVKSAVMAAVTFVASLVQAYFNLYVTVIRTALNVAVAVVRTVWNTIKTVVSAAVNAVLSVIRSVWNSIQSTVSSVMNTILSVVRSVWNSVKSAVSTAISSVRSVVSSGVSTVKSAIDGLSSIPGKVRGFFQSMLSAINEKISSAVSTVRGLPSKIIGALGDLGNLLRGAGQRLIQGLIDGITSKIKDIGGAMSGIASKIRGFLPGSPVKEGPLVSWNNGGAGKRLGSMLAYGLDASRADVGRAADRLAGQITLNKTPSMPTLGGSATAAVAAGTGHTGDTYVTVEVAVKELEELETVKDFLDLIGRKRVDERREASGKVVA